MCQNLSGPVRGEDRGSSVNQGTKKTTKIDQETLRGKKKLHFAGGHAKRPRVKEEGESQKKKIRQTSVNL